jgi:hypothetical protein
MQLFNDFCRAMFKLEPHARPPSPTVEINNLDYSPVSQS